MSAATGAPWRVVRSLCLYAAAAVSATVFFFWLHHLGNDIPYELAQQRFATAPLTGQSDSEIRIASEFEHCEIAGMVLAGAREDEGYDRRRERYLRMIGVPAGVREDGSYGPLVDAVLPWLLRPESSHSNFCPEARAASDGAHVDSIPAKFRYWWGGKALFAISLRWLSVVEFYRLVEAATYVAWLLFACAMALHGARALAVALPPVAFGLAFSGAGDFSGPANGLPYLWAVSAATVFALLLARRRAARAVAAFCFAAGMVSSWLWLFDGHNFLVVALLGMIVWLAREGAAPGARVRCALRCIALYIAGFAVCFSLGQITRAAVFDRTYGGGSGIVAGPVASQLFSATGGHLERTVSPRRGDGYDLTNRAFVAATPSMTKVQGGLVIAFSVFALAGAAVAVMLARRRGESGSALTFLWFVGLLLAAGVLYALPNNTPVRSARYLSLSLALCWSCLAAVAWNLWGLRGSLAAAAGALVIAAWPAGLVTLKQRLWQDDIEMALAGAEPVARADFDVYIVDEGKRIVYVKKPCAHGGRPPWAESPRGGWHPRFFLRFRPKDSFSWERIDFKFFGADFATRDGSRCVVMQSLPVPVRNLESIETGQGGGGQGVLWSVAIDFMD